MKKDKKKGAIPYCASLYLSEGSETLPIDLLVIRLYIKDGSYSKKGVFL